MSNKITLLAATAALALSFGAAHAAPVTSIDQTVMQAQGGGASGGLLFSSPTTGTGNSSYATGGSDGYGEGNAWGGTGYAGGKSTTTGDAGIGTETTGNGVAAGVYAGGGEAATASVNQTADTNGNFTQNTVTTQAANISAGAAGSIGNAGGYTMSQSGANANGKSSQSGGTAGQANAGGASSTGASSTNGGAAAGASVGGGAAGTTSTSTKTK